MSVLVLLSKVDFFYFAIDIFEGEHKKTQKHILFNKKYELKNEDNPYSVISLYNNTICNPEIKQNR